MKMEITLEQTKSRSEELLRRNQALERRLSKAASQTFLAANRSELEINKTMVSFVVYSPSIKTV